MMRDRAAMVLLTIIHPDCQREDAQSTMAVLLCAAAATTYARAYIHEMPWILHYMHTPPHQPYFSSHRMPSLSKDPSSS
jgi:hypothetical protein